jgi:hypothetical protein
MTVRPRISTQAAVLADPVLGHGDPKVCAYVLAHCVKVRPGRAKTKIVQGWPKLWANFRALINIFSQSVGPSLAIWANPVQFTLKASSLCRGHTTGVP